MCSWPTSQAALSYFVISATWTPCLQTPPTYRILLSSDISAALLVVFSALLAAAVVLPGPQLIGGVICFAESDVTLLQSVFQTRFYMHQFVYQHPEVKGMEMMVADAIKAAPAVIPADLADETASVEAKADRWVPAYLHDNMSGISG